MTHSLTHLLTHLHLHLHLHLLITHSLTLTLTYYSLTHSLQVHSKLVHLYLANLNAIATQAAIVTDLGFGSIREVEVRHSLTHSLTCLLV
jgi:hypothetical protein